MQVRNKKKKDKIGVVIEEKGDRIRIEYRNGNRVVRVWGLIDNFEMLVEASPVCPVCPDEIMIREEFQSNPSFGCDYEETNGNILEIQHFPEHQERLPTVTGGASAFGSPFYFSGFLIPGEKQFSHPGSGGPPKWDITENDIAVSNRLAGQIADLIKPEEITLPISFVALDMIRSGLCRFLSHPPPLIDVYTTLQTGEVVYS